MMLSKYKFHLLGAAALLVIGLVISNLPPKIDQTQIATAAALNYPAAHNYRQTINDCGPFNIAAVVRTLTGNNVDSAEFARTMKWRLPNKYTTPWGMEKQLKDNGVNFKTPSLFLTSDSDKILYLKQQLSQNKPVIILGERDGYEHYMTIFGFDTQADEFYLYDSLHDKSTNGFTTDDNGTNPGNITLTTNELLEFWRGGGMYGLYKWYTIVAGV